ncbi:PREDICTED: uncharacterized protein F54H12.2-like [Cyphomyrmex costatus]|uniref:Uncharacterized protein F54H12.2 n=1 Tax=Cyphomyrmex costatus TaxID=456900 RepID=A0A151II18_9HYME|nr:PREDICTED: uncharacterized protein F54H12.2-like [Cyphomyrmex costatus]KYN02052.1 Uncharacterized protein F54H12.2 [Cyphomyrmex costatus]
MSFLHTHSCECLKSELELFTVPPTQATIESSQWIHYKPISSLTDDSPTEFVVSGLGEEYIDLPHTILSISVQIRPTIHKEPSKDGDTTDYVGPVNNFMHSLFNQVDVFFNQKLISPPNNAYAYRAYIETLLNYGPAAKNSHLTSVLWYEDKSGSMDDLLNANDGQLVKRRVLTANGKKIDLMGHLHCDVFNQERFLINGVEIRLRSRDTFCLMDQTERNFEVHIIDATLLVRRSKISPGILLAHAKALAKTTAKYPLTRVEVKSISIYSGIYGETLDNVILGQIPKRLIIGFVDNRAFNGNRMLNPFNFHHYKINFLSLYVDGTQIPSKPLQPDFTKEKLYMEAYHTFFSGTGIHFLNEGNAIFRRNYPNGYCLFAFDLTPDLSANDTTHWNLMKHGNIRIEVRFEEALENTINCIIYAEYDNFMEIDASRQVIVDYGG